MKEISQSLFEADQLINGARQDQYGAPEHSFKMISEVWNWYLANRNPGPLEEKDIAIMMSLFKHARMLGQVWKRDNGVDAIGYLAILEDRIMINESVKEGK